MQVTNITVTERREVDHLCITLNMADVEWLNAILCDWIDNEHANAASEADMAEMLSHDHTVFAASLIDEACTFMWGDGPNA